ncbi:MAG: hypothetical protein WEC17_01825 [Candidatus Saccharimonadales bacterium]
MSSNDVWREGRLGPKGPALVEPVGGISQPNDDECTCEKVLHTKHADQQEEEDLADSHSSDADRGEPSTTVLEDISVPKRFSAMDVVADQMHNSRNNHRLSQIHVHTQV